jgi:hypothetical protein
MKHYTVLPNFISDIRTLDTIYIELSVDVTNYVQSAQMIGEGILDDTQVLADWNNFIYFVRKQIINNPSLVLLLEQKGTISPLDNITPQSTYFYIGVKNGYGELDGKILIDFRLSMHEATDSSKRRYAKHEQNSLQHINSEYPDLPDYWNTTFCELIVNKRSFKSYEHAERAVEGKLNKLVEQYGPSYFPDNEVDNE